MGDFFAPRLLDITDRADRILGHVTVDNFPPFPSSIDVTDRANRILGIASRDWLLGATDVPGRSWTLANGDTPGRSWNLDALLDTVDVSDRAGRLLGIAGRNWLLGATDTPSRSWLLGATDVPGRSWSLGAGDTPNRSWNLSSLLDSVDVSDRAARLLGTIANFPATVDTDAGRHTANTPRVAIAAPASGDILANSKKNASGTIITLLANKTYRVRLSLTATIRAAIGAGAIDTFANIAWTPGAGGTTAYTPLEIVLSIPASSTIALNGENACGQSTLHDVILYVGTANGTLAVNVGAGLTQWAASASAEVIA